MSIPQFTAEHSLDNRRRVYRSGFGAHVFSTRRRVSPQLRAGGGFGASDSCDGCDTFNYATCCMDCPEQHSQCTRDCLARSFECSVCNGPLFQARGSFLA